MGFENISSYLYIAVGAVLLLSLIFGKKADVYKDLKLILSSFNLKRSFITGEEKVCGYYNGCPVEIEYIPGGRNSRSVLEISMEGAFPFSLRISEEGAINHFLSMVGVKDIEIGDDAFDYSFRISSKDRELARKFLQSAETRERIKDLFNYGFKKFSVKNKEGRVSILMVEVDFGVLKMDKIRNILDILNSFAEKAASLQGYA